MAGKEIDYSRKEKWEKDFRVHFSHQLWLISYKYSMQISCNVNVCENGVKKDAFKNRGIVPL